ncbi:MAG: SanA/YdcF family protein [Armatimonadota bacterium]
MNKIRKPRRQKMIVIISIIMILLSGILFVPRHVIHSTTADRVFDDASSVPHCRVALILGAKVYPGGGLSPLLRDRVNCGIELYKSGRVEKLLMSGDNRFEHYNEPDRMAEYAIRHGVDSKDISRDYAGRRTYDSIYRAEHIFGLDKVVVISQRAHAERAVFISDRLGIKTSGLSADVPENIQSTGGTRMLLREFPAAILVILDVYVRHPQPVMGKKETI